MKAPDLLPAINTEAIYAKSKVYAQRALRCKDAHELDEYQLWASLALELLGKACLASIHPSLVVNPTDHISLFAAAGVNLGTDVKTIASHTLYERLRHVVRGFDDKVKRFCDDISQRRNAELHSGELPFREMKLAAWEGRYWHAAQVVLDRMDYTLVDWLGATQAKAPSEIVAHARQATIDAALIRIENARDQFKKRTKKEREIALREAKSIGYRANSVLYLQTDAIWSASCPACGGQGVMGGIKYHEEVLETSLDYDEYEEDFVETSYGGEEFYCPACNLRLNDQEEINAAELDNTHVATHTRERRYKEEYNNE